MNVEMLKDGTGVVLRELTSEDLEQSCRFFAALPEEDRQYLRFDVTKREVVASLIREAEAGRAYRVVALANEEIVAHGALEIAADSWHRHIGEIRVVVARSMRGKRLGAIIIGHLYRAAERRGVVRVVARMAGPQTVARHIFERLGFTVDAVMENHVTDTSGKLHPEIVMSCALDDVARALREYCQDDNWPDG